MKVTTEGERVIDQLWDVIAAKGFEKDMYFEMAAARHPRPAEARGHRPREHGAGPEVHGQLPLQPGRVRAGARPATTPPTTSSSSARARQGARQDPLRRLAGRLRPVRRRAERRPLHRAGGGPPDPARDGAPGEDQQRDLDFLLTLGELFTLVVYGQLILEQAALTELAGDTIDQIFDVIVRDFSGYTVALHGTASSTEAQQEWARRSVRKPVVDSERFESVWQKVRELAGAYEMRA